MVHVTSGPRRVPEAHRTSGENVGRAERWFSVLGGSALAVYGLDRRDSTGALLALAGALLIHRGATARCPVYRALGVNTADDAHTRNADAARPRSRAAAFRASDAVKVERTVTVNRPPAELYALWTNPDNLPRFMDWLEKVESIGERRARWRARGPGGKSIEWVAEIVNDVPDSLIAWKSVDDADIRNAGSVHFRPSAAGPGTDVTLVFEWVPPAGKAGLLGAKLLGSDPDARIREGLDRFKALAEAADVTQSAMGDY